jgi:hypothetical protein
MPAPAPPAAPVERLKDAPLLSVLVSTCGPANQFVTPRAMHLQEHAAWWRGAGRAWWVVAAEIAAFASDAEREVRAPRLPHRETYELTLAIHELGLAPARLDWRVLWVGWSRSGAEPEVLEVLAVVGLAHGWLGDAEYRATKAAWLLATTT